MKNPPVIPLLLEEHRGISVCCLLSAVCCLLSAVCCLLSAVCCLILPFTLYPFFSAFFTASTVSALESDVKFFRSPSFS
jgi:hypothetical protein